MNQVFTILINCKKKSYFVYAILIATISLLQFILIPNLFNVYAVISLQPGDSTSISWSQINSDVTITGESAITPVALDVLGGDINLDANRWIWSRGNLNLAGASNTVTIANNNSLCLGGVCRNTWPSSGLQSETDTLQSVTNRGSSTSNAITIPLLYDSNNGGYYLDPNSQSRLNYGVFDDVYSYNWLDSPILYDANDSSFYLDPNSTSRLNYTVSNNAYTYGWMQAPIFYDANDNGYYLDPNGRSVLNRTDMNTICLSGVCRNNWPSTGLTSEADTLQTVTNRGSSTNIGITVPNITDANNGSYRLDPDGTSQVNNLNAQGSVSGCYGGPCSWLRYSNGNNYLRGNTYADGVYYDENNPGYYLDPNSTSRLNYGIFDNAYSYGWMQAPIFYDANNNGYYLNPDGMSNLYRVDTNEWFRVNGNGGIYWNYYGGGWNMQDSTWLRSYGEKSLYTGAGEYATSNIQVGGNQFGWTDRGCTNCKDTVNGNPNLWLTAQDAVRVQAPNGLCVNGKCGGGTWGGVYAIESETQKCRQTNPYTGGCSCPPGFGDMKMMMFGADYNKDVHFCY